MPKRYSEPVDWNATLLALAIWAAHFSALWGASSVFPGAPAARWIALAATIAALAALAMLWRLRVHAGARSIPAIGVGLAAVAIIWGALPALVG